MLQMLYRPREVKTLNCQLSTTDSRMPRFVVLEHNHPFLHWDFMLEAGDVLRTWRLHAPPDQAGPIATQALPDHRVAYLDYEGPVSGDRGEVQRWDAGEYEWVEDSDIECNVTLSGRKLVGRACLRTVGTIPHLDGGSDLGGGQSDWEFTFAGDQTT